MPIPSFPPKLPDPSRLPRSLTVAALMVAHEGSAQKRLLLRWWGYGSTVKRALSVRPKTSGK